MSRTTSVGPLGAVLAATTITLALTGCVANGGSESAGNIRVESTADACKISASTAPSGPISFDVTNSTNQATEFYILADDGLKVVGELENIAPGAPRTLTVSMPAGDYFTVCKPGMVGAGVGKTAFTVSDSGSTPKASGAEADQISAAADNYVSYVKDQVAQLIPATQGFVDSYVAGNDDTARSLYPVARSHYERIEPVAESFGVLDQALDFREADVPSGDEWTG